MITVQNRNGLPASLIEQKRFFRMTGTGKGDTPSGWNNPETWEDLDSIPEGRFFGFVAGTDSDYLFIDFDHVLDDEGHFVNRDVKEAYRRIWDAGKTYIEKSKSGHGLHIIADLGDLAGSFDPVNNTADEIIVWMNPDKYKALPKDERDKVPKIELFYHQRGRYIFLTGNNTEVHEVAKDEDAAAIFRECLAIRSENHIRYAVKKEPQKKRETTVQKNRVIDALSYISAADYETWIRVGIALYNSGIDFDTWDEWSRWVNKRDEIRYTDYDPKETAEKWKSFERSGSKWNAGTIFSLAKAGGWNEQPVPKLESAADFIKRDIPPLKHIVDGLVTEGVGILAGTQKTGKSWLCYQLAECVAAGKRFLGKKTTRGSALYFDLEQAEQLRQERLKIIMPEPPGNLYFINSASVIGDGFEQQLEGYLMQVPDTQLVIVDVLDVIADDLKRNEAPKRHAYRNISALKQIATKRHIAIICVMHFRKMQDKDDFMVNISGSNGWVAAADFAIGITRKRGESSATLQSDGRTTRGMSMQIMQDDKSMKWQEIGSTEDVIQQKRLQVFRQHAITQCLVKAVKDGGGHWEGSAGGLKGTAVFEQGGSLAETAIAISKFIKNNTDLFQKEYHIRIIDRNENSSKGAFFAADMCM